MEILLLAAATFLVCWLLDKGFTKCFRSKPQHIDGKALRLNKHYGGFGVILFVLGLASLFTGIGTGGVILIIGGVAMPLLGIGLVVYYMTFGIYYNEDGFLYTSFGKRSVAYSYQDICSQRLYISGKHTVIELFMKGGRSVQINSGIQGAYAFMDYAFARWLGQTGKKQEDCSFYDPDNSCWFPSVEE